MIGKITPDQPSKDSGDYAMLVNCQGCMQNLGREGGENKNYPPLYSPGSTVFVSGDFVI